MYRYVGTAKMRPDSFTPRRFATVMNTRIAEAELRRVYVERAANCGIDDDRGDAGARSTPRR